MIYLHQSRRVYTESGYVTHEVWWWCGAALPHLPRSAPPSDRTVVYLPHMDINEGLHAETAGSADFEKNMRGIAEQVRTKETPSSSEKKRGELEHIRRELHETYATAEQDGPISPAADPGGGYLDGVDREYREQVASLVSRAVSDGIPAAVTEAQKRNDPYLMDSFHDALARFLHQKMQENNLL